MSESEAVERFLAKSQAGQIPEPRDIDDVVDDPEEVGALSDDGGEPRVEGDEFGEPDEDVQDEDAEEAGSAGDPVVRFDDGTELPLSEVKRGFLRQQDYTRKTQETAEVRKAVEGERAQLLAEKKQAADRITPLIQQAIAIIDNPATQAELNQLREIDPGAYAVRMMEMQQKRAALAQLDYEQRQLRESAEREEAERFQHERAETAKQSRGVLMEKIPAAKKDFATWYRDLGKWVLDQGIPPEAWDSEVDHRIITLAWKAKQYDEATRKAPATSDRLRKAPQPLRPGAAKQPGHAQARELREATERAYKSGSVEDMAKLQILKGRMARR